MPPVHGTSITSNLALCYMQKCRLPRWCVLACAELLVAEQHVAEVRSNTDHGTDHGSDHLLECRPLHSTAKCKAAECAYCSQSKTCLLECCCLTSWLKQHYSTYAKRQAPPLKVTPMDFPCVQPGTHPAPGVQLSYSPTAMLVQNEAGVQQTCRREARWHRKLPLKAYTRIEGAPQHA